AGNLPDHGRADDRPRRESRSGPERADMTTHEHGAREADGKAIDPVCGMTVDPATTPHHATHDGTGYHFCGAGCRTKFLDDPQRYLHPEQADPLPPPPPGTRHTCPMHPEIVQDGPGTCPICGMALEPEMPGLDDGENPELVDFRRRFWGTLPLSFRVMRLARFGHRLAGLAV